MRHPAEHRQQVRLGASCQTERDLHEGIPEKTEYDHRSNGRVAAACIRQDRRFNNDPRFRRILSNCGNRSFDAGSIKIILFLVIVRRRCNHCEISIGICFFWVNGCMEVQRTLAGGVLLQKSVITASTIGLLPLFRSSTSPEQYPKHEPRYAEQAAKRQKDLHIQFQRLQSS